MEHISTMDDKNQKKIEQRALENAKRGRPQKKLKFNENPKFYISKTGRSFKIQHNEHIKALTQPQTKSNFAEYILDTNNTYANIDINL